MRIDMNSPPQNGQLFISVMACLPDLVFDVELLRFGADISVGSRLSRWRGEGGFKLVSAAPASYGCPHFTVAFFFLAIFAPFAWQCPHPLQLLFLSCTIFVAHPVQFFQAAQPLPQPRILHRHLGY